MSSSTTAPEKRGSRNTIQRTLVLEAVRSLHNHPTSADVYDVVRECHPNISRATVYRNLNLLADAGEVLRIQLPNGADCYDFRCDDHFHARCKECGHVFDIDMPRNENLVSHVQDTHGFQVDNYEIVFTGTCPNCLSKRED